MTRGPKPKPIELHRLHGTMRPSRHGPEDHPIDHLDGVPEMPTGLPAAAKKLWKEIVPKLVKAKVATEIDGLQLEAMCRAWAAYQDLRKRAEAKRPYDDATELEQWRLEKRTLNQWKVFDSIASRFGMTPADRVRLRSSGDEGKGRSHSNPLAALGISNN